MFIFRISNEYFSIEKVETCFSRAHPQISSFIFQNCQHPRIDQSIFKTGERFSIITGKTTITTKQKIALFIFYNFCNQTIITWQTIAFCKTCKCFSIITVCSGPIAESNIPIFVLQLRPSPIMTDSSRFELKRQFFQFKVGY